MKPPFVEVWTRVVRYEGHTFRMRNGDSVTYSVEGNAVRPDRTDYRLSRSNFEKAYALMPVSGPGGFQGAVRGPSYVWAILNDSRISG